MTTYNLVSSYLSDVANIHDGITSSLLSTIGVGGTPLSLAFDTSTGNLIEYDDTDKLVKIHDGVTVTVLSSFSIGGDAESITYDTITGNLISLHDSSPGTIKVHDKVSAAVLSTFASPNAFNPRGLTFDTITGNLISAGYSSPSSIYTHDGVSASTLSSFGVTAGQSVSDLAFDPSTGNLISCSAESDKIYIRDGISNTILDSWSTTPVNSVGLTVQHVPPPPKDGSSFNSIKLIDKKDGSPFTPIKLADFKDGSPFTSIKFVKEKDGSSFATTQLRAFGIMEYYFDLRNSSDTQEASATGAPPQTVFPNLFTGVSDGLKTLHIRSVQKYKNFEDTIDETISCGYPSTSPSKFAPLSIGRNDQGCGGYCIMELQPDKSGDAAYRVRGIRGRCFGNYRTL